MDIIKKFFIFTIAFLITLGMFSFKVYAAEFYIRDMKNGSFEIVFDAASYNVKEENFHISYRINGGTKNYFEDVSVYSQGSDNRIFLVEYKKIPVTTKDQNITGEVYYLNAGTVSFDFNIYANNTSSYEDEFQIISSGNGSFVLEFEENKTALSASDFTAYLYVNDVKQGRLGIDSVSRVSGFLNKFEVFYDSLVAKSYTQEVRVEVSYQGGPTKSSTFKIYSDGSYSDGNIGYEYSHLPNASYSIVDIENGEVTIRFDYDVLKELSYRDFSAKYYVGNIYKGSISFDNIEESQARQNRQFTLYFDKLEPVEAEDKDVKITMMIFYDGETNRKPAIDSFTIYSESLLKEVDIEIAQVNEFKDSIMLPTITITEKSKNTINTSSKSKLSYIKLELPDGFEWIEKGDLTGKNGLSDVIDYEVNYEEKSGYDNKKVLLIGIINSESNRSKIGSLMIDGLEMVALDDAPLGEVKLRISGAGIPYERFTVAKFTYNPQSLTQKPSYTVKLIDGFSQMIVNDSSIVMDTNPFIENNRFMLPVSYIAVAFGIPPTYDNIKWDSDKRMVTVIDGDTKIDITIGSKVILVNGIPKEMDTAALIRDNRTFVPMRVLGELLGFEVEWNDQTRTAILMK